MNVSVRSYLSSGLAAATATVVVVAPMEAQVPAAVAEAPPIALVAQAQPLQLPALIAEQVSFNTGVAVDFVVTGAQLIGRQAQVAQTFVDDVRTGTPIPVAAGRAVAGFINIEVVAGHELVGFGRELADFQIQSLGNLVAQLPPAVASPARRDPRGERRHGRHRQRCVEPRHRSTRAGGEYPCRAITVTSDHARRCLASTGRRRGPGHAPSAPPSCAQCANCCSVGG